MGKKNPYISLNSKYKSFKLIFFYEFSHISKSSQHLLYSESNETIELRALSQGDILDFAEIAVETLEIYSLGSILVTGLKYHFHVLLK